MMRITTVPAGPAASAGPPWLRRERTTKGGGVSARPLPLPLNPALLKHADQRRQHLENRITDQITQFAGSMLLVYLHIIWFAAWIGLGVEPYPFGLLTMIVSLEAIFLSTFVMISQNRAGKKRQVLADHQWQTVQRRRAAERAAAAPVHPDSGAHRGHPRARHHPVAHQPGRHLAGMEQTEGGRMTAGRDDRCRARCASGAHVDHRS
jgi:hypothetical protein